MTRILAEPSAWSKLVFAGPDRKKFLNGLVTADVLKLPERRGTLSCLLTPKGRLRADFELYDRGEDLLAIAAPQAGANIREDLGRKLMLSETTMSEAAGTLSFVVEPPFELQAWENRERVFSSPRLGGYWVLAPSPASGALEAEAFERRRVERGVPLYGVDTDETTIPQEARLDAALSFDKGCYLGQETISRVHHMGHVNRLLVRLRVSGEAEAGSEVFAGDASIGRMTSRAGSAALATVRLAESKPGTRLRVGPGASAEVL